MLYVKVCLPFLVSFVLVSISSPQPTTIVGTVSTEHGDDVTTVAHNINGEPASTTTSFSTDSEKLTQKTTASISTSLSRDDNQTSDKEETASTAPNEGKTFILDPAETIVTRSEPETSSTDDKGNLKPQKEQGHSNVQGIDVASTTPGPQSVQLQENDATGYAEHGSPLKNEIPLSVLSEQPLKVIIVTSNGSHYTFLNGIKVDSAEVTDMLKKGVKGSLSAANYPAQNLKTDSEQGISSANNNQENGISPYQNEASAQSHTSNDVKYSGHGQDQFPNGNEISEKRCLCRNGVPVAGQPGRPEQVYSSKGHAGYRGYEYDYHNGGGYGKRGQTYTNLERSSGGAADSKFSSGTNGGRYYGDGKQAVRDEHHDGYFYSAALHPTSTVQQPRHYGLFDLIIETIGGLSHRINHFFGVQANREHGTRPGLFGKIRGLIRRN